MARATTTRKVLWRVAAALALLATGFVHGYLTHRQRIFPYWSIRDVALQLGGREAGSFHEAHPRVAAANRRRAENAERFGHAEPETKAGADTAADDKTRRELEALGYATGTELASEALGVTVHDRERAVQGLNLYSSAHGRIALLIDMDGRPVHRWEMDDRVLWPDSAEGVTRTYFRRVKMLPDGDLLAIFEGHGIVRIDRNSQLKWKVNNKAHHDISLDAQGNIHVPTREAKRIERIDPEQLILEDFVEVLDPDGHRLKRISLLEAFERSNHARTLEYLRPIADPFHTNSAKVLSQPGLPEPFLPGRVLLSIRELNTLAVLDMEREEIVWTLNGQWHRQHEATLLEDGHVLLFDNRGIERNSRVLELDPATQQIVWSYGGKPEHEFYSSACGTARRLDNGNTLVTESDRGRAFEVTRAGEIVWEFLSPHRAPNRPELVATLFEVTRVEGELPWLGRTAAPDSRSDADHGSDGPDP